MSAEWQSLQDGLKSEKDKDIFCALQTLQIKSSRGALEQEPTLALLPLCMDKLSHHDIEVRGLAMDIIASQLKANNWSTERLMQHLAKRLASPNVLDLKAGKSNVKVHKKLHTDIIYAITELHNRHPSKMIPVFKPLLNYLVECTDYKHREVSTMACKFWGNLKIPPVPQKAIGEWMPTMLNKLSRLVQSLLNSMKYNEEYVQYLESQTSSAGGGRPQTASIEFEKYSDLRNYAALGFEKLVSIFTTEVTPIFKLHVQKWLTSKDWLQQEAIVLAISAFCEAMQGPHDLKELVPEVMANLLVFYNSEKPLLQSITCFTMVNFMNIRVKGLKDPFGRMLRSTLSLLSSNTCEVQDQAMRSLASLLAYGDRDFSAQSRKIISALVKANSKVTGRAKHSYYECIGHTFGRLGVLLEEKEIHQLINPLMEHWMSFPWAQNQQAPEDELMAVCSPLCAVAMFTKSAFERYNDSILEKIVPYLNRLLSSSNGIGDPKGDAITAHIVGYLDLISAMYEGQGSGMKEAASQHKLIEVVIKLLQTDDKFRDEVIQSSMALLGNICKHSYDEIKAQVEPILELLDNHIDSRSDNIRNNALWTLVNITKHNDEKIDNLFMLCNQLTGLFMNLKAQEGVVINSALALTYLAVKWPDVMARVIYKEDVFTHLCALLQTQFSSNEEKHEIFSNLCLIIASNMNKVPKECWVHFCASAAMLENAPDQLKKDIKNILKDVRTIAGNAVWNKINTMLGQNVAYQMRKKYKLY